MKTNLFIQILLLGAFLSSFSSHKTQAQNIALNKGTEVSSNDSGSQDGQAAVDGDMTTRWSSNYQDNQWISIDLGGSYLVNQVVLNWETAYGSSYEIQLSGDNTNWTTAFSETNGDGQIDDISLSASGRYLRIYGLTRGTQWGFSLWEIEVYGSSIGSGNQAPVARAGNDQIVSEGDMVTLDGSSSEDPDGSIMAYQWSEGNTILATTAQFQNVFTTGMHTIQLTVTDNEGASATDYVVVTVNADTQDNPNLALNKPVEVSSTETDTNVAENVNDGNIQTRWASIYQDGESVTIDFQEVQEISQVVLRWETAYAIQYEIQLSMDAVNWTTMYTESSSDGGTDAVSFATTSAQFIRLVGIQRNTPWGISLWELEAYKTPISTGGSQAPVANAWVDRYVSDLDGNGSEEITLDASKSYDPDSPITSYLWKIDGVTIAQGKTPTVALPTGLYEVTLEVSDGIQSSTDQLNVLIGTLNSDVNGLQVKNSRLYDSNGNEFMARGINLQYADNPSQMSKAFTPIANLHANSMRILWRMSSTTVWDAKSTIDRAIENNMISMPNFWDLVTCSGDTATLGLAVDKWVEFAPQLATEYYARYMILNIGNEWGHLSLEQEPFTMAYINGIQRLRDAGYTCPIIVNANHCGQDLTYLLNSSAVRIFHADPLHNILFSAHPYSWLWDTPGERSINFDNMVATGLPFIIAEHAGNGYQDIQHQDIWQRCKEERIGVLAWSWKGNDSERIMMDMSYNYDWANLTPYGNMIVHGENGLMETSVRATVFEPFAAATTKALQAQESKAVISPNPVKGTATFSFPALKNEPATIVIYNLLEGSSQIMEEKTVQATKGLNQLVPWELPQHFENGLYYYIITTSTHQFRGKFMLER